MYTIHSFGVKNKNKSNIYLECMKILIILFNSKLTQDFYSVENNKKKMLNKITNIS